MSDKSSLFICSTTVVDTAVSAGIWSMNWTSYTPGRQTCTRELTGVNTSGVYRRCSSSNPPKSAVFRSVPVCHAWKMAVDSVPGSPWGPCSP